MRNVVIGAVALGLGLGAWLILDFDRPGRQQHTDRTVAAWIQRLDDTEPERRYQAGLMLAAYAEDAVPALLQRLERDAEQPPEARGDPDEPAEPRKIAADALALIGAPAREGLIEALTCPAHYERALAVQALETIGVGRADLPRLLTLVAHDNVVTAGMAAHLIGTVTGGPEAVDRRLREPSLTEVHAERLLFALSRMRQDDPASMTPYLQSKRLILRLGALHVLQGVGPDRSQAEALAQRLADAEPRSRAWAATLLRRLGSEARGALIGVVQVGEPGSTQLALGLLGELGSEALADVPILRARLDDPAPNVRAAAAEALYAVTQVEDEALPVLLDVAATGPPPARILAIAALGGFKRRVAEIVVALVPLLAGADPDLARVAAISLGNLGPAAKQAEAPLERAAQAENVQLVRAAKLALALIRGPRGD